MKPLHKNKSSKHSILRQKEDISFNPTTMMPDKIYRVQEIRNLTETTYVLRFDRNGMEFLPGQHITLGLQGDNQVREYSIYSTIHDPFLEVLIREVDNGTVSRRLRKLKKGSVLNVDGPFGFFTLDNEKRKTSKYLFVATGTGIAPFHSIAGAYPELDYKLVHGIRFGTEAYEKHGYAHERYISCTSRDNEGHFKGRVTDYLKGNEVDSDTLVYLCGNCDMIYEVYDLLTSRGLNTDQIKTEVYF